MDLQAQKAIIIEKFKQINDENLINAIKSLLDYALQKEDVLSDIPEEDQKIVMERLEKYKKSPEQLLDWDEAKDTLET